MDVLSLLASDPSSDQGIHSHILRGPSTTLVLDIGQHSVKSGVGARSLNEIDLKAASSFQTDLISPERLYGVEEGTIMSLMNSLEMSSSIVHQPFYNCLDYQSILQKGFHEMKINTNESNLLVVQSLEEHFKNKEKITEIAFEYLQIQGIYFALSNCLALYSVGKLAGGVLDTGAKSSCFVPVYDGYACHGFTESSKITGEYLTNFLDYLFRSKGQPPLPHNFVEKIKERKCVVSDCTFEALKEIPEESFKLPDHRIIHTGNEVKKCPEAMFIPSMAQVDTKSFPRVITDSVEKLKLIHRDNRHKMILSNLHLCGGNASFPGLQSRLYNELGKSATCKSEEIDVRVIPHPTQAALNGGCILASLSTFKEQFMITKSEYDSEGFGCVLRKCV